jgi:tetratricopeptide (TPR) repeat protein
MIRKWFSPVIFVFLLSGWALFGLNGEIGKVVDYKGEVLIDAFGKGSFIQVVREDLVYKDSVIKTGKNGTVIIYLGNFQLEIPPGSMIEVSDLLSSESEKNNFIWFQSLLDLFKDILESPDNFQEKVALGGRAEKSETDDIEWMNDEEMDSYNFLLAQKNIQTAQYSKALNYLLELENPESDLFNPGEISYLKGFCYFQMGNFSDAEKHLNAASRKIKPAGSDNNQIHFQNTLLFQLGASNYFLGHGDKAAEYFTALLEKGSMDKYEPYVYIFLIHSLVTSGKGDIAETYLAEARKRYKDTPFEKEFLILPEKKLNN